MVREWPLKETVAAVVQISPNCRFLEKLNFALCDDSLCALVLCVVWMIFPRMA